MTQSDPLVSEIARRLQSVAERAIAENARRLEDWSTAIADAPVTMCDRHPGQPLTADPERSAHASDRAKRVVIVCRPCPMCEADAVRQREERRLLLRGIPARSLGVTMATWQPDWEPAAEFARAEAWKAVQSWTQGDPPVPFLIILGGRGGTGKTALGVAALRTFGRDIRCLEFRDWINALLAESTGDRGSRLESVRTYTALMIDDFGNRHVGSKDEIGGNAFERDAMATVLNYRFERRLPTIITSNLAPAAFAARLDDRTVDRIRAGRVTIDASNWPSRRAAEGI